MIEPEIIQKVNRQIYRQFPEVKGVQPKVRRQSAAQGTSVSTPSYLLTYQAQSILPGSKSMSRAVRVVVTENGRVLKVTTSR